MTTSTDRIVFRSAAGWVWLALVGALAAFLLGDVVVRAGWYDALLMAPWFLLVAWIVWVFQTSPRIEADARGVVLVNVLRVVRISWPAVREVRLRYQAVFHLRDGGRISAWGGAGRRLHLSLARRGADPAAEQVEALEHLREEADPGEKTVRRSWDVSALIALVVIAAWAAWALAVTGGSALG